MIIYALKLLFPVLVVLGLVIAFARRSFQGLLTADEYRRAATALAVATIVAFLSRNPGLLMLAMAGVGLWAGRFLGGGGRGGVAAMLLLVLVIPPVQYDIEGFGGINRFLELNSTRVLTLVVLLPLALRALVARKAAPRPRWVAAIDVLVIGYSALKLALLASHVTGTGLLRALVEALIDVVLPYYAVSRSLRLRADVRFVLAHLALACVFAAGVGCVESVVHRNLYEGLQWIYGYKWQLTLALGRGDHLRVQAMTAQPILLAFEMIFALGVWTYLAGAGWRRAPVLGVFAVLAAALVFTWSRGPWLGAIGFGLCMLGARKLPGKTFRGLLLAALALAVAAKMAGADTAIVAGLSRVFGAEGKDLSSIDYRRQLLDTAIALIRQSPWVGVPNYAAQMQELKQGEGIIDLVNSYVAIALDAGLIGLVLYLAPFVIAIARLLAAADAGRLRADEDVPGGSNFGAVFASLAIAALGTIFTTSTFSIMPFLLTLLLALPVARLQMAAEEGTTQAPIRRVPFDPDRMSFGVR